MAQKDRTGIFKKVMPCENFERENFKLHELPDEIIFDFRSGALKICLIISACIISFLTAPRALIAASILPILLIIRKAVILKKLVRLNLINLFVAFMIIITWPDLKEGFRFALLIIIRMNLIFIILLNTGLNIPFMPAKMRVLIIMTVRGIFIMHERFTAALISIKLRAKNLHGLLKFKVIAYLIASGLLRSSERAERVYQVIGMRGGFNGFNQEFTDKFKKRDLIYILIFMIYGGVLIFLNAA